MTRKPARPKSPSPTASRKAGTRRSPKEPIRFTDVEILPKEESRDRSRPQPDHEAAQEDDPLVDSGDEAVDWDAETEREWESRETDSADEERQPGRGRRTARLPAVIEEADLPALSPSDPLRRYMEEVRRHPLLSPEEEFRLALRMRDEGDIEAARTLVSANLRLVAKIAFEYRNYYSNVLDLIQEGNIGLMKAVSKFDPTRGARLGYYASWWIRSYILKYLLDNFRLVRVGTTQAQKKLFYHLMREKERLEAQGLAAGPKLLAERLDVKEKDVIDMSQRLSGAGAEVSLDAPVSTDGRPLTHVDLLTDDRELPSETLERDQLVAILQDHVREFVEQLNDKEQSVFQLRLMSDEPNTLQEVADRYGLTRERARQIEAKVIQKLREFLRKKLEEPEDWSALPRPSIAEGKKSPEPSSFPAEPPAKRTRKKS